jgi:hypothetical protein
MTKFGFISLQTIQHNNNFLMLYYFNVQLVHIIQDIDYIILTWALCCCALPMTFNPFFFSYHVFI